MLRATFDRVAILFVQSKSPVEVMRTMTPFAHKLLNDYPDGIVLYSHIIEGVGPPSREAQQVGGVALERLAAAGARSHSQVIEMQGFLGAAARAFQTGINLFTKVPLPTHAASNVDDALTHMYQRVSSHGLALPSRDRLRDAILTMRSEAKLYEA